MTVRYIALMGFAIILASFSIVVYKLPFQIMFKNFHDTYLVVTNGNISIWLIASWFLIGGYRTSLIMAWDKNESYFSSFRYRMKAILFVPISMFTRFEISWYKLPSIEYLNSK